MESELFPLLLITLLATAVPVLAARIKIIILPMVVGEILAGIIIGKSGFNLAPPSPALDFLAEFGFIFLMFLSGLELNFERFISTSNRSTPLFKRPFPLATLIFLCSICLAVTIGYVLSWLGLARSGILMGLILSTTSLGLVVPVLKEQNLTDTFYGQTLLVCALVGDFAALLLLGLVIALVSRGPSFEILFFLILLAAFAPTVRLAQRARNIPLLTRTLEELSHAAAQIQVRGALALMVGWIFLSRAMGVEVILGAFLAGAFISLIVGERESLLREKLDAIGFGFFIPIFFIMVGVNFDLKSLIDSPAALGLVFILAASAYLVKIIPGLLLRILFTWKQAIAGGVLLSARLSLIIAAAAISLDLGLITPAVNSAVILMALITCTLSPLLFSRLYPLSTAEERTGVIILGSNQLALFVGDRLERTGENVTYIGTDSAQLARLHKSGKRAALGRPFDLTVLEQAGAPKAEALMAIEGDSDTMTEVCKTARENFNIPHIIALAEDSTLSRTLKKFGASVVQTQTAAALALEGALHFPWAFDMLADLSSGVDFTDVVMKSPYLAGRQLRSIRMPGNVLVMGVRRGGETLVPNGETVLELEDILILVGEREHLKDAQKLIQGFY